MKLPNSIVTTLGSVCALFASTARAALPEQLKAFEVPEMDLTLAESIHISKDKAVSENTKKQAGMQTIVPAWTCLPRMERSTFFSRIVGDRSFT